MTAGRPSLWTPERVALATRLWRDGCSATEIARDLGGVSRNAIIGKLHRMGLKQAALTDNLAARRAPRIVREPVPRPPRPRTPPRPPRGLEPRLSPALGVICGETVPFDRMAKQKTCKWPLNDGQPEWLFCAQRKGFGEVYCAAHMERAKGAQGSTGKELIRKLRWAS